MTTRTFRALLAATLALSALSACGGGARTYRAEGTAISPAASGDIRVGKTDGAQTVAVDLDHLAPPQRLGPGLSQYAVWVIPEGQPAVLAGTLAYDAGTQSGSLRATTPFERFDVLVTAEPDQLGTAPSGVVVVRRPVP